MTRLERRIHQLIEKAILEHGYVLRADGWSANGFVDDRNADCCLIGALSLSVEKTGICNQREDVGRALNLSITDVLALELGFEGTPYERSPLYDLGHRLRERYVVNS